MYAFPTAVLGDEMSAIELMQQAGQIGVRFALDGRRIVVFGINLLDNDMLEQLKRRREDIRIVLMSRERPVLDKLSSSDAVRYAEQILSPWSPS
jgi:hypothetical protein